MCEKKPGPRCSADAQKSIVDINAKIAAQEIVSKEANQAITDAEDHLRASGYNAGANLGLDWAYENAAIQSDLLRNYRNQREIANLNYNATPEGMKSLEKLMQGAGNAVIQVPATSGSVEMFEFTGEKGVTVNSALSKRKIYADKLANAEAQRNWQRKTLNELVKTEEKGKEVALFVARNLIATAEAQQTALKNKHNEVLSERYRVLAKIEREGFKPEYANRLTELEYARKSLTDQQGYAQIRINDLESYANGVTDGKAFPPVKSLYDLMNAK